MVLIPNTYTRNSSEFDDDRNCGVLDEDPLLDDLEEIQKEGNNIFEYHQCELFPERWFKLVVVLMTGKSFLRHKNLFQVYSVRIKIDLEAL